MEPMYRGIPFSPQTTLTDSIGAADTVIPVADVSAFPDPPNYATIGTDSGGETIKYTAKAGSSLSGCTRGVEGNAKAWGSGSIIARNHTAKDMESLQKNVEEHDTALKDKYSSENAPPYPVTKVAGKTGDVSLGKSDVGLGNVDNVKQYSTSNPPPYPVTKVSGKTGDVSLEKSDVGLGNVDNVKQYSASNPPPYPVTSVNGNTGAVTLTQAKAFSGTFGASGWTGDTVYTYKQSVSISGLKESYPVKPVVDISLAGTSATTDQAAVKAYGKVVRFVTGSGFLTAYAMEKPAADFSVSVTVVE